MPIAPVDEARVAEVRRAIAALAMLAVPPVVTLKDSGFSGVLTPVLLADRGGTRLPDDSRSKVGRVGSGAMEPSL